MKKKWKGQVICWCKLCT